MLRGTAAGLEFVFSDPAFEPAAQAIVARLGERPDFYRGSRAAAIFSAEPPGDDALLAFVETVAAFGVELRGIYGPESVRALAERIALPYLGEPKQQTVASIDRKRAGKVARTLELTERARSLDPDFAGARADIASRRARGETSVPQPIFGPALGAVSLASVATNGSSAAHSNEPTTLYHRGTLRGGRALQQFGTIVVVGDVNPGAELVATGDIVVFGSLRGTAHAGAQGDAAARVIALELLPTQLRIATLIAVSDDSRRPEGPEVAFVTGDRISIAPLSQAEHLR